MCVTEVERSEGYLISNYRGAGAPFAATVVCIRQDSFAFSLTHSNSNTAEQIRIYYNHAGMSHEPKGINATGL